MQVEYQNENSRLILKLFEIDPKLCKKNSHLHFQKIQESFNELFHLERIFHIFITSN